MAFEFQNYFLSFIHRENFTKLNLKSVPDIKVYKEFKGIKEFRL